MTHQRETYMEMLKGENQKEKRQKGKEKVHSLPINQSAQSMQFDVTTLTYVILTKCAMNTV